MEQTNQKEQPAQPLEALLPSESFFQRFAKWFPYIAIITLGYVVRVFYTNDLEREDRYKRHLEEDVRKWESVANSIEYFRRQVYDTSGRR